MDYIEVPLWLAIVIMSVIVLLLIYFIFADFFVNLISKKYDLELKEKKKKEKKDGESSK